MTQVITWFANARRRLKEKNRLTWNGRDNGNDAETSRMHPSGHRKNDTLTNTAPLKNWLNEHLFYPYPTKGEQILLARMSQ